MVYDYDLIVIGGGSGGMACAKEAKKYQKNVILFDFVIPTNFGTKWGFGGTCVNVGCIPKKLFHYSSIMHNILHNDANQLGWIFNNNDIKFDWNQLVNTVQKYIKSLNFSYRTSLRSEGVEYINATAKFLNSHEIIYTHKNEEKKISGEYIVIATGGRPFVPSEIEGAKELCITSDDLFSLKNPPGKTLIIGASYIALECAGFLTELGFDVTVAVRSILLRGFDRQCAEKVGSLMKELGTKFIYNCTAKSFKKLENGQIKVEFNEHEGDIFDTVLFATGRQADTQKLNLDKAGVITMPNHKIDAKNEKSNISNIFAVGDVLYGKPELTPVAIKAGELLSKRLFDNSTKMMDYNNVPTTVFTPFEYGCVGLSEEDAIKKYGEENIEIYLSEFSTLEFSCTHREKVKSERNDEFDVNLSPNCLSKLVCLKQNNNREDDIVVGFHFVGPNAGEITQGMAIAVSLKAKKSDFDNIIGIHPTDAESFANLYITKSSGENWIAKGGCGGGKCG